MALSAVYRTGQTFGANYVIDVLIGKLTDRVIQYEHHNLPTFGVGVAISVNEWRSVLRQLVAQGVLRVDIERHGALKFTPMSREVLLGNQKLEFRKDRGTSPSKGSRSASKSSTENAAPKDTQSVIASHDKDLWDALKVLRKSLADTKKVPAFVVFNDRCLVAMCRERPLTRAQFLAIDGVGPKKCDEYAEQFMAEIRRFCDD